MFFLRESRPEDLDTLHKLARMVHFINLPADREIIAEKIARSRASFVAAAKGKAPDLDSAAARDGSAVKGSPIYMFSLVDTETQSCHGTSMIVARMGRPGNPNFSFLLRQRHFFSKDLGQGTTHTTLQLHLDESGPSEIGGLILTPSLRRHPRRLGKQVSFIRFHYIGLHRRLFSDHLLAEMMAPLTPDGRSVFWEALGRRFINLSYQEADLFCQRSREFMTSLLPREEIYATLLPPEARQVIGEVGADTRPARKMLEDIGFRFTNRVDPFDGGPHLEANTDEVPLIRDTQPGIYAGTCPAAQARQHGFVSIQHEDGRFRAVYTGFTWTERGSKAVRLPKESALALQAEPGMPVGVTPFELVAEKDRKPRRSAKPQGKPKRGSRAVA